MRRQTLTLQTLVLFLIGGIFCSWLRAQPPPETATVTGTVTEAGTGQAAAGVTVKMNPKMDGEVDGIPWIGRATTDERGCFTLEKVPEGRYTLSLEDQGYEVFSQELHVTGEMEPLALTVKRLPRIRGQLRRPDGTLLTNAGIHAYLARFEEWYYSSSRSAWLFDQSKRWTLSTRRAFGSSFNRRRFPSSPLQQMPITTDEEGHYEIPVPQPGKYLLTLIVPGVGYAQSGELNIGSSSGPLAGFTRTGGGEAQPRELSIAAQDPEGIDLQLAPGASVVGQIHVRDTVHSPWSIGIGFMQWDEGGPLFYASPSYIDKHLSKFTLQDLPAGTYQVETYRTGVDREGHLRRWWTRRTLTLADGQAVTDFVIEVTPPPVVSGHLLAPDGTPLAGREVELRGYTIWDFLHGWNWDQDWDWDKVTQLTLDGNGGFTLYPPATGTAHILIRLADIGYVLQTLEIQGGEDITNLEWRLKPFKAVVGQVREKRTGEPLAGVQVWLEPRGVFRFDLSFQATSRADGRFELQGLVEGEYQVSLSKPGYRYSGERRIQVAEDTLPDELHLDLELEEENWVGEGMNLSVLDDYGQGMPRAWWPLKKRFQSGSLLGSTDSPPQPEK